MRWGALVVTWFAVCATAGAACVTPRRGPAPLTPDTPIAEIRSRVLDGGYPTDGCVDEIDQALRWHPGHAELLEIQATCLLYRRIMGKARAAAEASIAADPNRPMAHLLLAQIVLNEDPEIAAQAFETYFARRTKVTENDDYLHVYHATALLRLGRIDDTLASLERARHRQRDPRVRPDRRMVALANSTACLAHALRDDFRRGLQPCQELDQLVSRPPSFLPYALARLYAAAGDHARARFTSVVFATSRGETLDRAVLDDPAALATWLRSVPPPLQR